VVTGKDAELFGGLRLSCEVGSVVVTPQKFRVIIRQDINHRRSGGSCHGY